jgi:hypothetical protein
VVRGSVFLGTVPSRAGHLLVFEVYSVIGTS